MMMFHRTSGYLKIMGAGEGQLITNDGEASEQQLFGKLNIVQF
jgi:hypothetical protein